MRIEVGAWYEISTSLSCSGGSLTTGCSTWFTPRGARRASGQDHPWGRSREVRRGPRPATVAQRRPVPEDNQPWTGEPIMAARSGSRPCSGPYPARPIPGMRSRAPPRLRQKNKSYAGYRLPAGGSPLVKFQVREGRQSHSMQRSHPEHYCTGAL